MFTLPKENYKTYGVLVYLLRDVVLYIMSLALIYGIHFLVQSVNHIALQVIGGGVGLLLGSLIMINFHE